MRYFTALLTGVVLSTATNAYPYIKRADGNTTITDGDVLNYALTLEHLEASFYKESLDKYDEDAFESAGYPSYIRNRVVQIAAHEAAHVEFLTSALQATGVNATEACTYDFGVTDPKSFIAIAGLLESVGTSAYIGAAQFVSTKDYLTAAASITATEARHASWIGSAGEESNPWSGAFETPLSLNQVYTLASAFITSCPESNPVLPVSAFPTLTVDPLTPGETASFNFTMSNNSTSDENSTLYAAVLAGLSAEYLELKYDSGKYESELPSNICGPAYILITKSMNSTMDADVVAGPAVARFPCSSTQNPFNVSTSG